MDPWLFACYNRASPLRFVDLAVILVYLAGVTWFGARFRESQKSLKDYFLGGRNAPWWAIALSIVSAETSTLTIIGTPPLAYAGSYVFLQVVFGYLLARIVISTIFLPQYFQGQLFTAYELMQRRFGPHVRRVTAGLFLLTRALAEGVRVFAISIVISIILHTGEHASIIAIVLLTLFYTFEGGMTAVIWTDVIQMIMYVLGAGVSFFILLHKIPGGWPHVRDVAGAAGKLRVFDFRWSWTLPYTFWAGVIGGCFLTTASHGTDQLVVQRLLSAKTQSQSRLALFSSWIVILIQFSMFLTIGLLLWVLRGGAPIEGAPDRLYPSFIWQSLPVGIAGLVMAAILAAAMANLSAALNSLASATVVDFYEPLTRSRHSAAHYLKVSRLSTVFWGAVLAGIGIVARHWGSVFESGLSIASVTLGILLGVFLLGVLTKRPGEAAAIAGVLTGAAVMLFVKFETKIPFTWWVMIGSSVTFAVGYAASFVFGRKVRV
ncbi:MAG TPA: sodium:solute symporter [Bryobacteraceae bacterium]|nr:sodium:solute symporter [Bryobacteraceae bacterium]